MKFTEKPIQLLFLACLERRKTTGVSGTRFILLAKGQPTEVAELDSNMTTLHQLVTISKVLNISDPLPFLHGVAVRIKEEAYTEVNRSKFINIMVDNRLNSLRADMCE